MTRAPQAHEHIDESAPALEISSVRIILANVLCAMGDCRVLRPKSHKNLRYHGDLGIETKSLISPKRSWPRMSDLTPIDNSRVVEFPKGLVPRAEQLKNTLFIGR